MLEKPNYKFNKNMPMPDRFINGQALGMVSQLRYGLFPMSYNGCEIIAVYNYMRLHGVKTNMADLALEIYPKGSVLMGLFGSNPYMLRHYFQKRGMSEYGITDYERFKREFPKAGSAIISFWTKRPLLSSLHTVAVESKENGGVRVYNYSNSRPDPRELSGFDDFVKKSSHFIIGYIK